MRCSFSNDRSWASTAWKTPASVWQPLHSELYVVTVPSSKSMTSRVQCAPELHGKKQSRYSQLPLLAMLFLALSGWNILTICAS